MAKNSTPKSVLLTWVILSLLFLASLFYFGRPRYSEASLSLLDPIFPATTEEPFPTLPTSLPGVAPNRNYYYSTPTLTWDRVAGATGYELQISITEDFGTLINVNNPLPANALAYTSPTSLPIGTYYWHVRALDAAGHAGAWSTLEGFVIVPLPPVPTATYTPSPTATATLTVTPTLRVTATRPPPTLPPMVFATPELVMATAIGTATTTPVPPPTLPGGNCVENCG